MALLPIALQAQAQQALPATGFNFDGVGEGVNFLATTDGPLDLSEFVLYTAGAAADAGAPGGLPDSGAIAPFQLQPYAGPNTLKLEPGESGRLELSTPLPLSELRLLGFATEGEVDNLLTRLHFSDGSTEARQIAVADWFYPQPYSTIRAQWLGRVNRINGTFDFNGYAPILYDTDISPSCVNHARTVVAVELVNRHDISIFVGLGLAGTPFTLPAANNQAMSAGQTAQLTTALTGGQWISLDETVATVSSAGLVQARAPGTARIVYEAGPQSCEQFAVTVLNAVPASGPWTLGALGLLAALMGGRHLRRRAD